MPLNFPPNPVAGDEYSDNQSVVWVCADAVGPIWERKAVGAIKDDGTIPMLNQLQLMPALDLVTSTPTEAYHAVRKDWVESEISKLPAPGQVNSVAVGQFGGLTVDLSDPTVPLIDIPFETFADHTHDHLGVYMPLESPVVNPGTDLTVKTSPDQQFGGIHFLDEYGQDADIRNINNSLTFIQNGITSFGISDIGEMTLANHMQVPDQIAIGFQEWYIGYDANNIGGPGLYIGDVGSGGTVGMAFYDFAGTHYCNFSHIPRSENNINGTDQHELVLMGHLDGRNTNSVGYSLTSHSHSSYISSTANDTVAGKLTFTNESGCMRLNDYVELEFGNSGANIEWAPSNTSGKAALVIEGGAGSNNIIMDNTATSFFQSVVKTNGLTLGSLSLLNRTELDARYTQTLLLNKTIAQIGIDPIGTPDLILELIQQNKDLLNRIEALENA